MPSPKQVESMHHDRSKNQARTSFIGKNKKYIMRTIARHDDDPYNVKLDELDVEYMDDSADSELNDNHCHDDDSSNVDTNSLSNSSKQSSFDSINELQYEEEL